MGKLRGRFDWLLSPHYSMERFGVSFLALSLVMVILLSSIGIYKRQQDQQTLDGTVQYTTNLGMSLSGMAGAVDKVYVSEDKTRAFVLLHFDDTSRFVSDINEYTVFLLGSDLSARKHRLQSDPYVSLYMFGSTGYIGLYFVDSGGFPMQIIDVVLRCDTLLGDPVEEVGSYWDESFYEYDQCEFYFNPGGSESVTADFLDGDEIEVSDVIETAILDGQEDQLRETLDADLEAMKELLTSADEYIKRLDALNIIVPDAPVQIRGDAIKENKDGTLSLVTSYNIAGGYTFDWRKGSLKDGYASMFLDEKTNVETFIQSQSVLYARETMATGSLVWRNADGTPFSGNNPHNLSGIAEANNAIQSLTKTWSNYYELKKQYQTADMEALLVLELSMASFRDGYAIRTDEDLVIKQ